MAALQLQTVRFKDDSTRTISVRPNVAGDVPKKDFYVREVKVGASPKEPLLSVRGFSKILATAELPLVLSESHMSVDDVDTVLSNGNIDASRITFRVSDVVGGTLQARTSASAVWVGMTEEALNGSPLGYYAFTLADLQGDLVAFSPDADASTLTFKVQVADDGVPGVSNSPPHLSDSDPNDNQNDADPASVSISIVALKEIEAGQQGALNDDDPRGGLTPDTDTLQAWLDADGTLEIFVELQKGKSGIVVLEEGVVEEVLSLSAAAPNITATWDAVNNRLSLQGSASATVGHFEAALAALQLQTVRFKDDSTRTISVSPNVAGDVPKKDFYVREVKVGASPIEPFLSVHGFTKILATAERYLVLSESHILVDDVDTVLGDGNVDASNITLRITELLGGTLEKRISASADWVSMTKVASQDYYAFTLADLQGGLVSVKASAGVSSLTFKVQAADNENNFSDSDPIDDDADPASVSIPVVALKEVEAGQKGALNDDSPRGGLTPDAVTLQAWLDADSTLEIFVELQGGKSGIVVLEEGVVEEVLSLSGGVSNITATWDAGNDRLSLQGDASATVGNFETALAALQLQTVRFKEDSYRTISVRPNINVDVPKKDFYVREVKVGASPKEPLLSVRGFSKRLATAERPLVLGESHILVDDVDTRDSVDPTKVDASKIKFRITNIRNGKLMRRPDTSSPWVDVDLASGTQYREFSLADLQSGLVSLEASALASTLTFDIQAVDDENNFSDSDRNDNQNDADPASVSIPVVALKEVEAGQKGALNDDSPRGGLTPDPDTLQAWLDADSTLEIFVELQGGKSGIAVLEEGTVVESLSLSVSVSNITVTWDAVNDRLSLQGSASATVADFEAALAALRLQTVRFKDDSYRTISVSPNVAEDVPKKDFYVREVKVGGSPIEPLLSVRFGKLRVDSGQRLILGEEHILVDDVDTRDVNDNVDASKITLRITGLTGGELQSRSSSSESDWTKIVCRSWLE